MHGHQLFEILHPVKIPKALGNKIVCGLKCSAWFVDRTAHNWRSTLLQTYLVDKYSKRQACVQMATSGSKFVAAVDQIVGFCNILATLSMQRVICLVTSKKM
jgi:hypothetical protein